ncbi:MAG: hypothetical protein ABI782_05440, partial [Anaerolineaceae bacterium]
ATSGLDSAGPIPGYYASPFPGEDGGPRRQMIARLSGLAIGPDEQLAVTSRAAFFANMVVLRDPGEVFVQGNSQPWEDTTAWVERIDPMTLDTVVRSPDLPGGPFWAGGILVHANGDLYVTYGRFCHRLDANCALVASRELPQPEPYNSLLALSDGNLVMKNFVRNGSNRSYLSVLEPSALEPVCAEVEVPEGSIARISRDLSDEGEFIYVVGDHTTFRYHYANGTLNLDKGWEYRYRTLPESEQSYGWDAVIADGNAWFMDNGDNVFSGSLKGGGVASGPLRVHRVSLSDAANHASFEPFGLARGTIVNPPLIDTSRGIVVAFDSGNGRIGAFHMDGGPQFAPLWQHGFNTGNHYLLFPDTGEIVVNDFVGAAEHIVVLDIESGAERGRIATASPVMSAVFQSPGWNRDVYSCSFPTISRIYVEGST